MSPHSSSVPLRVGLIGAGVIGRFRAQALAQIPSMRLVAVADEQQARARAIAPKGQELRCLARGEELAGSPDLDAVIVSTPPASHERLTLAALAAGKHVLCEKPLADSVEACERMVVAAKKAGRCLATGYTLRKSPAALLARKLVDDGEIGEIDHIRVFHGHKGGSDFGPAWITDHAATGGGTLMDNGIHMIDVVRWFLGDIATSAGFGSNHTWKKPGSEDNGFVLCRSTAGKVGLIHSSWTEWTGYGYRVEIYGTEGFVHFGYPPLVLTHARGTPGTKMKKRRHLFPVYQVKERLKGWQWSLVETLRLDLEDWGQAIAAGREAPASGRDGLEAVRIAQNIDFARGVAAP
jgi:predicted dehydrogenase